MKFRQILSGVMTVVLMAATTACGSSGSSPDTSAGTAANSETSTAAGNTSGTGADAERTLSVYGFYAGDNIKLADYAVKKIQEKYPNVKLTFENLPQDGGQTIKTRAATGDLPDLITVDSGTIAPLSNSKSIIPLESYIEKFNYKDKLMPAIIDTCLTSSDGHIYQFPTGGISPILWYYNKELFEKNNVKVPTNYEELMTAVKAFKAKGIIPMAIFGKEPWPLGAFFDSFALKDNPGGIYDLSTGKAKASEPAYSKAVEKMYNLIKAGLFQDGATNTDFDSASALFLEGKAAMFLNGNWYISDVQKMGDKCDIMTSYPTADPGQESQNQYAMTGGGDTAGIAVSASTKDKDFAAEIASMYAYNREVAEYQMTQFITAPIKTEGLELEKELDPISQKLLSVIPQQTYASKYIHTLPNTRFATTLTEEIQKLMVGESSAEFIKNVDKNIEASLK